MSLPNKGQIFLHWRKWLVQRGFDCGEPSCWACGIWYDVKYDTKIKSEVNILAVWNKVPLQRCHIVPKALGGSDEPENLFLMCKECHDLSPDTTSRDAFFIWVTQQDYSKRLYEKFLKEFELFSLQDDIELISKIIQTEKFQLWFKKNTSKHWFQDGSGSKKSTSTIVAAVYEYLKQLKESDSA